MNKKHKIAFLFLVCGLMVALGGSTHLGLQTKPAPFLMSNPSAIYCLDLGYDYQTIDTENGQVGLCKFPDGTQCRAWDFLAGKCGEKYSYCAQQGYGIKTIRVGNAFSRESAVCIDESGLEIGRVDQLSNLAENAIRTCDDSRPQMPPVTPSEPSKRIQDLRNNAGAPPPSFDWRNHQSADWLTPVKSQGGCGSCWAFGAIGITESAWNIATNNPDLDLDLSEQYLVADCSSAGSCCGGWHSSALQFVKDSGVPDENCLLYADSGCGCFPSGNCNCTHQENDGCSETICSDRCADWMSRSYHISEFASVENDPTTIKQALVDIGPLAVGINTSDGNFDGEQIYRCDPDFNTDHIVVIVGYDDVGEYWIVRNSWGADWNGDGHFNIGYGECSIEESVYYAVAPQDISISGYVMDAHGEPLADVVMNGLPGTPTTTQYGYYVDTVTSGWSGTVTPALDQYSILPESRTYTDVTSSIAVQNYTGTFLPTGDILLVDDDMNMPDIRSSYEESLVSLGQAYDVWDTNLYGDPGQNRLDYYNTVIWFSGEGAEYLSIPDSQAESDLGSWLDAGGCLLLSSQDYLNHRGRNDFLYNYLGVDDYSGDVGHSELNGSGSVFSGLGPYSLTYPFENRSDLISPIAFAELAFIGNQGDAAINLDTGVFRTAFMAFPFEALNTLTERDEVMSSFLDWCATPKPDFSKSMPTDTINHQSTTPMLKWGQASGAVSYEYCIDTSDNSSCDGSWVDVGTNTSAEISGLTTNTTYFWQVRALDGITTTYANSDSWWSFTTSEDPEPCLNGLCLQVNDFIGFPVPGAQVDIYKNGVLETGRNTDQNGYANVILAAGSYDIVVTSTNYGFQIVRNSTIPGWEIVSPTGTAAVTYSIKKLDDSPLTNATVTSIPSGFQGRPVGYTDMNGTLMAWITPGQYAFSAVGMTDPYYLEDGNIDVSDPTAVNFHAASLPTGTLDIDLVDFPRAKITVTGQYPHMDAVKVPILGDSSAVFSAGNYTLELALNKEQDTSQWYYALEDFNTTFSSGSASAITTGGDFTISTDAYKISYLPGELVQITNRVEDSLGNRIDKLIMDTGGMGDPRVDEQLGSLVAGGGGGGFEIYPNLVVEDPDQETIDEAQNGDSWGVHTFSLPITAILGTYDLSLTLDTGPHMGEINAADTFAVIATRPPIPADFNNDDVTDIAVYRPSTGKWFIKGQYSTIYGAVGDLPVPGDYDGNGDWDVAVYRPSTGKWFIKGQYPTIYGVNGDIPVPGDYNGDGIMDIAVYRPATGKWFIKGLYSTVYGMGDDIPVPGDYNGDGTMDIAVYRPSTGKWFIKGQYSTSYGANGDIPVPGDYDANGTWDVAIFQPSTGKWFVKDQFTTPYGVTDDYPLPARDTNADGDPYE